MKIAAEMDTMDTLDELFEIYQVHGDADYIGEPISQLAHAQQAAYLAQHAGASESVILGAFFHDIGHLCADSECPQMDGLQSGQS